MATKTISIMDDAYSLLVRRRIRNESFSEVIRRVLSEKKGIMEFAGAWNDMSENESEELYSNMKKIKKGMISGVVKRGSML